jgi:4-hydroxy-tetrahydrodipicolinate synthase
MYAGSLVALVTPMQPTGGIDYEAWSRLLEFHWPMAPRDRRGRSTGESATVTTTNSASCSQARRVSAALLLIANTGTSDTASSCERARSSRLRYDVDALLVASPRTCGRPGRIVPALLARSPRLARPGAALQRAEPHGRRPVAGDGRAPVARAEIVGIKEAVGEATRVRELVAGCAPDSAS